MLNAVVMSVFVIVILSKFRINVLFALIIAAITAGLMSGIGLEEFVTTMISGIGDNHKLHLVIFY
ncbi:GntT/GntP/DsdX family permease [Pseudogracilibacillus sp. SO30301A]|uniref:GntT/GntP/DsdX family permease n=1 Tax=Pseudogracilibacillus sp. SO30301A TaxID=3098291 RepID=UPI00300E544D